MPFNPIVAGVAAGAAFLISLMLGIIGRIRFSDVIMRACLFAALFFSLVSVFMVIFEKFLDINDEAGDSIDGVVGAESDLDEPLPPLEQNGDTSYNNAGRDGSADFDYNAGDFSPGLPGVSVAGDGNGASNEDDFSLESVELSVGSKPKKNLELKDLGPDVDGKKAAQAIQTMLRKDES